MKIKSPFGIAAAAVVGLPIIFLFILPAVGLALFKSPFPQKAFITLDIEDDELIISGTSGERGKCPPPVEEGCVQVKKIKKAKIKFNLDMPNMQDWEFSKIQLVAEASANAKLDFGTQTGFSEKMIADFYVKFDGKKKHPNENGIIELKELNKNVFTLFDRNKFKQTYSYQIEACPTTSSNQSECIEMDPMIVNEG
jgi:hypothetical protein